MNYKLEDLFSDQSFRRYLLNPHQEGNSHSEKWDHFKEENPDLFNEAKSYIIGFYQPLTPEEFESDSIEFRRKINITNSEKSNIISLYDQRRPKANHWLKYAAALAVIILSTIVLTLTLNKDKQLGVDVVQDDLIKKFTTRGQKMTKIFLDGTVVKLNSESSISYPKQFAEEAREVTVVGEAYFEVAHHKNWPFIVRTQDTKTIVLGTSFNVSAYPGSTQVSIALIEGNVNVQTADDKEFKLEPMKMLQIDTREDNAIISKFDPKTIIGWKDNIIAFKMTPFDEVEHTLERWFDAEITYDKAPVFEGGYTGDFENETLESILEGISTNEFTYTFLEKNKVLIKTLKHQNHEN